MNLKKFTLTKRKTNNTIVLITAFLFTITSYKALEKPSEKNEASYPLSHEVNSLSALKKALKNVKRGEVIIVKNGSYSDMKLTLNQKDIKIKAETPGQVAFTGDSKIEIKGDKIHFEGFVFKGQKKKNMLFISGKQNRVTRCSFIKCNPSDSKTKFHWVEIDGYKNRMDHCLFDGMNHKGVQVVFAFRSGKPGYHLFDNNYLKNRKQGFRSGEGSVNGFETIRIGYSGYSHLVGGVTIDNNLFENCDGEIEFISIKTSRNIIRNNTFRNSMGTVTTRQCMGTEITGNYFVSNGKKKKTGGIRIIGPQQTVQGNYFEGLTSRAIIDIIAGNFKFELGKLYKNGSHKTSHKGAEGFIFPKSLSTGITLNYAQVTHAKINNNIFVTTPQQESVHFNSGYGSKERTFLNEYISLSKNIFYSSKGPGFFSNGAPAKMIINDAHNPKFTDNIIFSDDKSPAPFTGIKKQEPKFSRDEYGILRSKVFPGAGPENPPLTAADVGPAFDKK